jgi:hypothetical protein
MRKRFGKGISKKTCTVLLILAGIVLIGFLFYSFTRNPRFFEGQEGNPDASSGDESLDSTRKEIESATKTADCALKEGENAIRFFEDVEKEFTRIDNKLKDFPENKDAKDYLATSSEFKKGFEKMKNNTVKGKEAVKKSKEIIKKLTSFLDATTNFEKNVGDLGKKLKTNIDIFVTQMKTNTPGAMDLTWLTDLI